ncbi:MAG: efflux RND transporter permease subunit [Bacteroidetes bacterium]|nr:efflux RND transporter permease subunit [Bacteroidota bacterium]
MISAALRKPISVIVVILGVVVFSVLALLKIPVDIFPQLNLPTIYIAQPYGGMAPDQMEGFIATRYQNQLLYVTGIKDIEVKNVQGLCLVKCTFYENVNMAQVSGEVANQVSRVMSYMPPGTVPPTVVRFDASSLPVGELVFSSKQAGLNEMQDLASTRIRPMFSQIPGASAPPPFGGNERTIVVKVNPELMTGYELTPDDIVKAVVDNNQISPAGNVRIGNFNVMTPNNTVVEKAEDFLNIPLKKGAGPTVFLRDVASVEDAADVTVGYALVNGKRSVYIPVTKTADASTMDVVNALKKKLPEMQSLLPDYINLRYEFDQSVYVVEAVKSLATEGVLGALLTGLMVFLFLRDLRSSLVVICTIPISIMAAVMLLNLFGQTINIMTLSGLALAIGILVDQATVAIENIHQHLEMGKTKSRAVFDASREVSFPLLLITFCILAVFAPAFLMTGVPKGMFLPLSLSVGFSMVASYILSQTFVPVVSNWWLHDKMPHAHTAETVTGFEKFKHWYLATLEMIISKKRTAIVIYLIISFGLIAACFLMIGKDLMPKIEHSRQFQLRLIGPEGLRIERTEEAVQATIKLIENVVGKENVDITSAFVGMTPSSYGTNTLYIFNSGPQEAILQVNLSEYYKVESLDKLKDEIRSQVKSKLKDITISFEPIELTDKIMSQGANTPIEVLVASKNLEEAKMFATRVEAGLKKVDFLRDVRINQPLNYPSLIIEVNREKAAQFSLSAADVAKSLVAATSSSRFTAKNLWLDKEKGFAYQVQVQVPEFEMASAKDIENIPLVKGQLHPTLGDIATITPAHIPAQYDRIGPRRIVTVSANVFKKDLGSAADVVRKTIKNMGEQPKGMVVEVRGLVRLLEETLSSLQSGLLLAIVVIFLLLSANYQSFKVSFVVLVTVPAVLAGSMVLLLITGGTLNLQSYMGIIMSVGVSIANAVLLVTHAEKVRLEMNDAQAAALAAGAARLRPILMTSIAMVVGMLPMASGLSESGEQAAPLGRAVIGGLIASTFAALLILPAVFSGVQANAPITSVSLDPDDRQSPYYDLQNASPNEN